MVPLFIISSFGFSASLSSPFQDSIHHPPSMTCPSNKSLLVYCCSILLLNGTIIASRGTQDQEAAGMGRETKKGSDLRSSIPPFPTNPLIAATGITKHFSSPSSGMKRDCRQMDGRPGKCFPPESCVEWNTGPENRNGWQVCEWLHEPIASSKLFPQFLLMQQKQPLTICCQEPALLMAKSRMRQLTQSFVEIPKRKANLHLHRFNKQCGTSFPSIFGHFHPRSHPWARKKRMVYGHSTTAHDHSWMAVLLVQGRFRCGGSLLSERVIVTSAHCLWSSSSTGNSSQGYEVMVGSTELGSGTVYQVLKAVRHPASGRKSVMNDIALLITVKPIVLSDDVNPICFPSPSMGGKALQGLRATMTGFGTYYYGGPLPSRLQETQVPIQGRAACSKLLLKMKLLTKDMQGTDSLICAGFQDGTTDACQGDSGGPLTIKVKGKSYLIGVISFGYRCNEEGYFGVATSVTHFDSWIRSVMRRESNSRPLT